MKKALHITIIVPLLLFISLRSFAGHERSGYLSYTCTKDSAGQYTNTYHLKIITYTDPTDVVSDPCHELLIFTNLSSNMTYSLDCVRTNYTPGGSLISHNLAGCGAEDGSIPGDGLILIYPDTLTCPHYYYSGVKFNIYEGDFTFNDTGKYVFGMVDFTLDNNIINIPSSSNVPLALVDTLNITNNSIYNNSPFPFNTLIDSACAGQPFYFNSGMQDPDNDSLSYTFLIPFITGTQWTTSFYGVVGYVAPSNLTVNAVTGELSWLNVPNTYGEYDVDILVKEYRRIGGVMVEIGSEVFAVQIYVKCCSASGLNIFTPTNEQISIYPNPSSGVYVIKPKGSTKQSMQVFDVNGKIVLSQSINGKTTIDASTLNEGVYNISIISNDGVINKRLVIVR